LTLIAAVGQARALDGREAGLQAARQALQDLGNMPAAFGLVIASYHYEAQQVIAGVSSLTGNMPLIGFSTSAGLSASGVHPHAVVVALVATPDARADVQWLAGYTQGSRELNHRLVELLENKPHQTSLVFADGYNVDGEQICTDLPEGARLIGALSCGDMHSTNAFQIAGAQAGAGGLALARLEGRITIGVGSGHGWQPVGSHFRITRSRGLWIRTLDGRPASEAYARLFGFPARDWAFPPLSQMARLYPLGLEQADKTLLLRAPLRVEADGSLRMNAPVADGSEAYLLVGSLSACRSAVQAAVQQAQAALGGAQPALALVFADLSWQMLFEAQPGTEIGGLREALGPQIPIAGGYTLGQFMPAAGARPQFLNQHLLVALIAEPPEKE
jgi:hypothetical protein